MAEKYSKADIVFEKVGNRKVKKVLELGDEWIVQPFKRWWNKKPDPPKNNKPPKNKKNNKKNDDQYGQNRSGDGNVPPKNNTTMDNIKQTATNVKDKVVDVGKKVALPVIGAGGAYALSTWTNEQKQNAIKDIDSQVSAVNSLYQRDPENLKFLNNNALLDSLITTQQAESLSKIPDVNTRAVVREGYDNFNQVIWDMSDPDVVQILPEAKKLKDYRKNLYDAGKLTPFLDSNNENYYKDLRVPGVNYNYPSDFK